MKIPNYLFSRSMLYLSLTATGAAHGVELADAPLVVQSPVEPNVVFLLDRSGASAFPSQQISNTSGFDEDDDPNTQDTNTFKLQERHNPLASNSPYEHCHPDQIPLPPSNYHKNASPISPYNKTADQDIIKLLPKNFQDAFYRVPPKPHIYENPLLGFFWPFAPYFGIVTSPKFLEKPINNPVWHGNNFYFVDTQYNKEGRLQIVHRFYRSPGNQETFNVYDPDEVCFFDPNYKEGDPNFYYTLYYTLAGKDKSDSFGIGQFDVYGNYMDWFIRDNTVPTWASTQSTNKPGAMPRFDAFKKALNFILEDIKEARMPLRVGLATSSPPLYGVNPDDGLSARFGATIEIGVDNVLKKPIEKENGKAKLNAAHLNRFQDFIENKKVETFGSITGMFQSLADVAYYFMEGTFTTGFNEEKTVTLYKGDDPKTAKQYTYSIAEAFQRASRKLYKDSGKGSPEPYPVYIKNKDRPTAEKTVIYENGFCQKNYVIAISTGEPSLPRTNGGNVNPLSKPLWASPLTHYVSHNKDYPEEAQLDINTDTLYELYNWVTALYDMDLRPDLKEKNNLIPYYISFTDLTRTSQTPEQLAPLGRNIKEGEGGVFSVSNLQQIREELGNILHEIINQSSTVGGVVNSSRLNAESKIFLTSFKSNDWSGDVRAYDLKLNTDIKADDYKWSAAEELSKQLKRNVYTYNKDSGSGVKFEANNWSNLSEIQKKDLGFVEYRPDDIDPLTPSREIGEKRIDYLLGKLDQTETKKAGFRPRSKLLEDPPSYNLIGDIFRSSPVYVGDPGELLSVDAREPMIYVGSNNGMLHAFRASDGREVFAYVPSSLSTEELLGKGTQTDGGLHRLTDPEYQHRFYVDLPAWYADVELDEEWRTVLIGGTGSGGKGLFALDITQPANFDADNVLWEIHGEAAPTPKNDEDVAELGYIIGRPTITKTNLKEDKWAVFVTSGYNSSDENQARLYVLDVANGSVIKELKVDSSSLSTPTTYDMDGDGQADRVYAGDLQGNIWAFDISAEDQKDWKVAFDSQPLYTVKQPDNGEPQPIMAEPAVVAHPSQTQENDGSENPNLLVMFGTGQYLNESDLNDTNVQSFYAIWDQGEALDDNTAFLERPFVNRTNALKNGDSEEIVSVRTFDDPKEDEMDWGKYQGWRIDFMADAGERIVTHPIPRGAFVHFNTLIPDSMACAAGGRGYLMSVCMDTGGTCGNSSFNFDVTLEEEGIFQPIGLELEAIPWQSSFVQAAGDDLLLTPPHMTLSDESTVHFTELDDLTPAMRMSWREILE